MIAIGRNLTTPGIHGNKSGMKSQDTDAFPRVDLPQVHTIGLMQFDPIWAQRMHRNQTAEILYIVKGSMNLVFEKISYSAQAGDILVVPPATRHRDEFDTDKGIGIFYCSFSWSLSRKFFKSVTNDKLSKLSPLCRNSIADIFGQITADLAGGSDADLLVTRARVLTILLTVLRELTMPNIPDTKENPPRLRRRQILQQSTDYLNQHYAEHISLDDIADAIDISPYYLSHVFSEETGLSLFSRLTDLRMEKAAEFLRSGKLNVSQVAHQVGYDSANYFSKVFRKHFKCSPSQFASKT